MLEHVVSHLGWQLLSKITKMADLMSVQSDRNRVQFYLTWVTLYGLNLTVCKLNLTSHQSKILHSLIFHVLIFFTPQFLAGQLFFQWIILHSANALGYGYMVLQCNNNQ